MSDLINLKNSILNNEFYDSFIRIYPNEIEEKTNRFAQAVDEFIEVFGEQSSPKLYSAPGRTEVGGNHTDHQHGRVLAAAVNLDVIAVVCLNDDNVIRVQSKGFKQNVVDLNNLENVESEIGSATNIVRGIAARFSELGYNIGGFDAFTTSNVLKGSGLSSSAAFENLIGTILSEEFNDGKVSAVEIAKISQYSEVHYFGKACGLMDQMVSSVGGFVAIDFNDPETPIIEKVDFDFTKSGYSLCIVDTKGSHSDLTDEYVAVPTEMKAVANFFGKEVLRDVDKDEFYANIPNLMGKVCERAIVRAMHFYSDNQTALDEANALKAGDFEKFKSLITKSGNSSFKYLQNIYSNKAPLDQLISVALGLSENILGDKGACRVHGGGFAGTIQAFVPNDLVVEYKEKIEAVFGKETCYVLNIRQHGGIKLA